MPRLNISVSVDGLEAEHNERRKPATYERISEEYRESEGDDSLHHHGADDEAPRIPGRVYPVFGTPGPKQGRSG